MPGILPPTGWFAIVNDASLSVLEEHACGPMFSLLLRRLDTERLVTWGEAEREGQTDVDPVEHRVLKPRVGGNELRACQLTLPV